MVTMMNQFAWSQDKALRTWIHNSRLDGFGKIIASVDPLDVEKMAILDKFKTYARAAVGNMPKLMASAKA